MNRIKYFFVPSEKKYLAVLENILPILLYVKEIEHIGYKSVFKNGHIIYLSPKDGKEVALTKKNLGRDFATEALLLDRMVTLDVKLEKYKDYISRRNFFQCQPLTVAAD